MTTLMTSNDWENITTDLSSGQKNYNELRFRYVTLAKEASLRFSAEYDQNLTNLEEVAKNASIWAVPHIFAAIDDAINALIVHRIFDVDRQHFADTYYKRYDTWSNAHEKIAETYAGIVTSTAEMDAYRTSREEGNSPIIGGGFGIEGAAKGILIAGAANLAIGTAKSLFALIEKGVGAAADAKKMKEIYRAQETKDRLMGALEESVVNVHLALLDALDTEEIVKSDFQRVKFEDREKAKRMLTNVTRGQVPSADRENILRQVLTLNPYYLEAYTYVLDSLGDENGKIERVAAFFHLDLAQEKRKRISALCTGETKEEINDAVQKVEDAGQRLGVLVESEFLAPLRGRLRSLDIAARTVDGQLYPTKELALVATMQKELALVATKQSRKEQKKADIKTIEIEVTEAARQIGKFLVFILLGIAAVGLLGLILNILPVK